MKSGNVFRPQPTCRADKMSRILAWHRNRQSFGVQMVRFVMDHQPPIVACECVDAGRRQHTFIDKVWIFSDQTLDAPSRYPQAGVIHCALLTEWRDEFGRESVRINTTDPDQLESIEGLSDFVVPRDQVTASTSPVNLL